MFTTGTYANCGTFKVSTQVTTALLICEFPSRGLGERAYLEAKVVLGIPNSDVP